LAGESDDFRKLQEQGHRTAEDIRKVLPADTVLIDFTSYKHFQPGVPSATQAVRRGTPDLAAASSKVLPKNGVDKAPKDFVKSAEPSWLVAFIVRPNQPVERVELGPIEPVETAVANWRRTFGRKGADSDQGAELRRLVWQPLTKYCSGAKTVLISPNSLIAPLPWAALPGEKPGPYLIDDFAIALAPIPSLLPELLGNGPVALPEKPSLLIVGDVDFDADPHKLPPAAASSLLASNDRGAAIRGDDRLSWPPLPGTRDEAAAIRQSFAKRFSGDEAVELTKDRATKSAVVSSAVKSQYLHFSTHGFFAPPQVRSALTANSGRGDAATSGGAQNIGGFHPGLLSGLVLAGANRPPDDGHEDGILTALEVEELDLSHVQLATLSACETGLGQTAGGEGLLGLQRAFQMAGAKTVVAGLWKVPDKATQLLMSRFYDNLWQKKMSKLAALREAQRWLLHEAPKEPGGVRGLKFVNQQPAELDASGCLPPYFWAAFVLSGDWR
jgi:CHAT domain-containing protein